MAARSSIRAYIANSAGALIEVHDASLLGPESWYCPGCHERSTKDYGGLAAAKAAAGRHADTCRVPYRR